MVYLSEIMDMALLGSHISKGLVTARPHQSLPLTILNYTKNAQFDRAWDDVTKKCRGLIYNNITGEVVARPFEKFFNWDEADSPYPPSGPALRMEKMDGSLGILYSYDGQWYIATRGSFHSEQADEANLMLQRNYAALTKCLRFDKTYLFEIIY